MPKAFWVVLVAAFSVAATLHLEWLRHRRSLRAIPLRIHVNGTRGKSSVTRLIAAILRAQGIATVAKTTGTAARFILPDGSEEPIPRDGPPNIGEMMAFLRRAARLGARAAVIECMAVDPELQRVAERRIVRPTITVITNARLDHTDTQGSSVRDIALGFPVTPGGTLVTADPLVAAVHGPRIRWQGGEVRLVSGGSVRGAELERMAYLEHPENVAVALEVARLLAIPRRTALAGIRDAAPDPGAAAVIDIPHPVGPWTLVNLFAANDPDSTFAALETVRSTFPLEGRPLLLFASRGDRMARSAEFASAIAERVDGFSKVVVWGERTPATIRRFRSRGVPEERLVDAGGRSPEDLTAMIGSLLDGERVVVGVGNIVGGAQRWLEHLADRITFTEWEWRADDVQRKAMLEGKDAEEALA